MVSEMQMKTTLRCNFLPIRLAHSQKAVGKAMGKKLPPFFEGGRSVVVGRANWQCLSN